MGKDSGSRFGHMVSMVSRGLIRPDRLNFVQNLLNGDSPYSVHYRGVGLKAPVTIIGWGRNIHGQPIPRNTGIGNTYTKDFAARSNLHAAGPLDIRFREMESPNSL